MPGAEHDYVYTPEQVAAAAGAIDGDRVLVYDADGYFTGVGDGRNAARRRQAGDGGDAVAQPRPVHVLHRRGLPRQPPDPRRRRDVVTDHLVTEVGPEGARGQNVWAPDPVEWAADAVVLVTERRPRDALYHELTADPDRLAAEDIEAVYRVGDCLAPRLIAECVFDGHRLAREIDSADPTMPLPFLRELPDFQTVG